MHWMVVCIWMGDEVHGSRNVFSLSQLELQTVTFQVMQLKKRPFDPFEWLVSCFVIFTMVVFVLPNNEQLNFSPEVFVVGITKMFFEHCYYYSFRRLHFFHEMLTL